jgi:hypothetical protein
LDEVSFNPIFIALYKDTRYSFQVEAWMKILHDTIIGNWHAIQLNNAFDLMEAMWNEMRDKVGHSQKICAMEVLMNKQKLKE